MQNVITLRWTHFAFVFSPQTLTNFSNRITGPCVSSTTLEGYFRSKDLQNQYFVSGENSRNIGLKFSVQFSRGSIRPWVGGVNSRQQTGGCSKGSDEPSRSAESVAAPGHCCWDPGTPKLGQAWKTQKVFSWVLKGCSLGLRTTSLESGQAE